MPTLSAPSRLVHWLVLCSFAVPGIGILLLLTAIVAADPQSMALLVVIFAAPIWITGLIAALELIRLARGGELRRSRAVAWAAVALVGGLLLAHFTGLIRLVAALITRPGDVGFAWPVVSVTEGGATYYHYLDGWSLVALAMAVGWVVLGVTALALHWADRRSGGRGITAAA